MSDYNIEADREMNRLYLDVDGMFDEETADEVAAELLETAEQMEPGFDMITDISSFKPVSQEATDAIERGKRGLARQGLSAVVRILGDSVVSKMQFDRVGSENEAYHVATAESRDQAERFLDEFRREGETSGDA